jgi:hypothetical protein
VWNAEGDRDVTERHPEQVMQRDDGAMSMVEVAERLRDLLAADELGSDI